jgi:adenylate cyclase
VALGSSLLRFVETAAPPVCEPREGALLGDDTARMVGLETREITVLVADVRGYTTLAERLPVERLSQLMGTWFRTAGALVQASRGAIDKFMGDGVK